MSGFDRSKFFVYIFFPEFIILVYVKGQGVFGVGGAVRNKQETEDKVPWSSCSNNKWLHL